MIRYNYKTRKYDYYVTFFDGRPSILVASFYRESDAKAYSMVRGIKC